MEWTVGVEQAEALKERLPEVPLACWHCGEATHCEVALETRREPEGEFNLLVTLISFLTEEVLILHLLEDESYPHLHVYLPSRVWPPCLPRGQRSFCSHPLEEWLSRLPAASWRWRRLCSRCCSKTLRVSWNGTWKYLRGSRDIFLSRSVPGHFYFSSPFMHRIYRWAHVHLFVQSVTVFLRLLMLFANYLLLHSFFFLKLLCWPVLA